MRYRSLLDRRIRTATDVFELRVPGHRVVCLGGAQAARLFYDETRFARHGALPMMVQRTLVGTGGVHTLDGLEHRTHKSAFIEATAEPSMTRLVEVTGSSWNDAVRDWSGRVVLFDEAAKVLTRAVSLWSGAPFPAAGPDALAANLIAMVDGFGTLGPRHWRARLARQRTEMWATRVITDARAGMLSAPPDSAVQIMASLPVSPRLAAVELLNIIRPTAAIAWYVTFAAHAMHTHPEWRDRLDESTVTAFAEEVRRFYPFAPLLSAVVIRDFDYQGVPFRRGMLALLDIYGTNHDPDLWDEPEVFSPDRFLLGHAPTGFGFIPQGGGDADDGHRCPGEPITLALLKQATLLLSRLDYVVPSQDLSIRLDRIPSRVESGFAMSNIRAEALMRR
ncbi:MAG TPA: cytochrome P450 [Candidatus Limnocylindrales bacterium]